MSSGMPPTSEQMVAQPAHTPSRMEYGKVSDTEDSRLMFIARKNGITGETQPQNVTRSRTPSWSHSFFSISASSPSPAMNRRSCGAVLSASAKPRTVVAMSLTAVRRAAMPQSTSPSSISAP